MRKVKKSQILEIIGSLKEVHSEIHKLLEQKDYHTVQSVLADCQQGAIEIGETIEKSEGEECPAVKRIESYCEAVFQLYQQIEQLQNQNAGEAQETIDELSVKEEALKKALEQISEQIAFIKVRKEVAFFPYKASMWDSLESVYLAAKEDPDCDAYCVPIPYFDRNPDGSFAQMHYEGREYPKNIEVIDWKTYNFEERKPDAIYIHNPYDDGNYVTCVHPRYFSSNLKKFTEELVYIPYFVLNEIDPGNQAAIDSMKHFVWTAGVIYADKVILQSEDMRQIYINEYIKAAKEYGAPGNHIDRAYLERKFLGLGSPKFDKVLNTKKEDLEIPEEWLKIIQKPDGSWKKVIFYNTSITAFLKYNEKMLDKMRDVFRIFKENKDEVALLWRPHPLIRATIESMRPQLWRDYEQLVNQYRAEDWGIYDDTPDMDRAVILSDAYYGDPSSVVALYERTGKAIMIQNPLVLQSITEENVKEIPVWTSAFCVDKEDIWFVHGKLNILMKYSMARKKLEIVGSVPQEKITCEKLYSDIYKYEDSIFLIPCWAKKIVAYSISKNMFEFVELPVSLQENNVKFLKSFVYKKNLYCLSAASGVITKISMDALSEVSNILVKESNDKVLHINTAIQMGNHMIAGVTGENNTIFLFNLKNEQIAMKRLGKDSSVYTSIASLQNYLFLYDQKEKAVVKYKIIDETIQFENKKIFEDVAKIDVFNEELFILQATDKKHTVIMNANLNVVYEKKGAVKSNKALAYDYYHGNVFYDKKSMLTYMDNCTESRVEVWSKEDKKTIYDLEFSRAQICDIQRIASEGNCLECNENEIIDLDYFLKNNLGHAEDTELQSNICGVKVYREVVR